MCLMNLDVTCILLLLNILNKKASQINVFQFVIWMDKREFNVGLCGLHECTVFDVMNIGL